VSLTVPEIAAVVNELQPLVGARVTSVWVHGERALTLELHGRAGETLLLLSADADRSRLHAATHRPPQPEAPFPFQAVLRREIEGARLAQIAAAPGDRVVALTIERARGTVRLVAELTGRHGNVFLVGDDGIIRASAGRNLSQRRQLVAGEPYVPPSLPAPRSQVVQTDLMRHGGSLPAPRPQVVQTDPTRHEGDLPPPELRAEPAPRPPRFAPAGDGSFPLSAAIEAHYERQEEERRLLEARRRLREPLRAALARATRAVDKLAEEAARVPAAEDDRRRADLLKTNLRAVPRGAREVAVTEWTAEGPREVRLAIDPALTPQANMERYYRRYRRIVDSAARVAAREAEVRRLLEGLRALLAEVDGAPLATLPRIEKEARRLGAGPRRTQLAKKKRSEKLPPHRTFRSLSGAAILVGRNAEQNDALTLRVARGNDLWLHARGLAGAHVVVRLEKGQAPDQDTLLDAAHLAVHFSDARGAPQADVAYTRAKHVRKPKGAAPGAVTYSQERVILLRTEPPRIERLLAEEEGEDAP
jgi:predicted ribosome quality control (RQC) complex YloA/Tae2 family protein